MYYKNEIDKSIEKLADKDLVKYAMSMSSLTSMLDEKGIEDSELSKKFAELNDVLNRYVNGDSSIKQLVTNKMLEIVLYTYKKYKLVKKGTLRSKYVVICVAFGIVAGLALLSFAGPPYMSLSIAVGVGLGLLIGTFAEGKADKEGRVY